MSTSCVAFLAAICVAIASVGGETLTRMKGGSVAEPGRFPSTVSIRNEAKAHVCGGSLIDVNFVLTAAHCVSNVNLDGYTIYTGSNNLQRVGKSYNISHVAINRYYNNQTMHFDLAIIRTTKDVRMNAYTKIAKLPPRRYQVPIGAKVTVVGWELPEPTPERKKAGKNGVIGKLRTQDSSPHLHFMYATILNNSQCSFDDYNVIASNYCAIGAIGRDVCVGDVGGPMMYKGYLVGTLILGPPCSVNRPSIYMKTATFLNWIEHVTIDLDVMAAIKG